MPSSLIQPTIVKSWGQALLICCFALAFTSQLFAQRDNRVVNPNYQQADLYSTEYLRQFVYDTSVRPNWIGKSDQFWYSFRDSKGTRYVRVNPERGTKEPLFDRIKLSSQLSEAIRKPLDPAQLSLGRASVNEEGTELKFVVENIQFKYVFATEKLENLGTPEREATPGRPDPNASREELIRRFQQERENNQNEQQTEETQGADEGTNRRERATHRAFSPDRTAYVFAKGHDLYLVEVPAEDLKKGFEKQKEQEAEDAKRAEQRAKAAAAQKEGAEKSGDETNVDAEKETVKTDGEKTDGEKKDGDEKDADKKTGEKKSDSDKSGDAEKKSEADSKTDAAKKGDAEQKSDKDSGSDADEDKQEKQDKGDQEKVDQKKSVQDKEVKQETDSTKETGKKEETKKEETKQDDSKKETTDDKGKTSDEKKSETAEAEGEEGDEPKELPIPVLPLELDETAIRLSDDGAEDYTFAGRPGGNAGGRQGGQQGGQRGTQGQTETTIKDDTLTRPSVSWTKNSKAFYTQRRDSRGVEELWVINSLATPRPTLEKYDYPMPGEENIRKSEMFLCRRSAGKMDRIEPKWTDEAYSNIHYSKDETELRFLRRDRLLRNIEICSVNLTDGKVSCLMTEGFENANIAPQSIRYLEESGDMIWWSERSGWGHFYLYDAAGKLKNAITSGEFLASEIVDIDEKNQTVYFKASGREPDENVYYTHLYAVQLDGSGLRLMDPGDANHSSILAPSKRYLVDNCSRVDMAPVSVLRSANGNEIVKLEETDLSRLEHVGWKMPETFVVKAADGVTDLYGNMWKPFDFDPKKKYPVIAHVYPGPQTEGTQHTFSATSGNQQMAQIGFIVIQVGHRGGSPGRGKAYGSYGYMNLRDYSLADKKAAIEQLAQRFEYVDVQRVGIYGHSGGGFMTAAALMVEPYNDFFKVGVSTAGNHDNNIYNNSWSERYHGLKEVVVKEETQAENGAAGQRGRALGQGQGQRGGRRGTQNPDFFYEYEMLNDDDLTDLDRRAGLDWDDMQAIDMPPWIIDQNPQDGDKTQDGQKQEVVKQDAEKQVQDQEGQTTRGRQRGGARTRQQGQGQDGEKTVTEDGKQEEKKVDGEDSEKTDSETKKDGDGEKQDDSKTGKSEGEKAKEAAKPKTKFEIHVPTNAELAKNLKGHLLLVHGELDNNVHPANTLRLVDALIKANKRFDMLYLPATRHGFGQYQPYVTQRMYEFFTEHLMNDYQSGANINEKVPLK